MSACQKILFPATFKDGELIPCVTTVLIDCDEAAIIGEKTDKAWDAANFKFECITGFFISYKGIEYGSTIMSESDFLAACLAACSDSDNRIHVDQFAIQFV